MSKFFYVMLIAFAVSTPAYADVFGTISSTTGGPEQLMDGQVYAPAQHGFFEGSMHGYPFYTGCCEPNRSYYKGLWDGYCGGKCCGTKTPRVRHHGGRKGGCGCDSCAMAFGRGSCGKGGCGYPGPHQRGGKSTGPRHQGCREIGGKGGCGLGAPCGSVCPTCGPKHGRFGLFDWLHFGHGHGCSVCGDLGCSSCDAGKGGFGKGGYIQPAPAQGLDKGFHEGPTRAYDESTLQPPQMFIEPTATSDRSAWRRDVPVNPFARPFGY